MVKGWKRKRLFEGLPVVKGGGMCWDKELDFLPHPSSTGDIPMK